MRVLAVIFVIGVLFSPVVASAAEPEDYVENFKDTLPEDMRDSLTSSEGLIEKASFKTIISEIYSIFSSNGDTLVSFLFTLLGLAAMSALAETADTRLRPAVITAASSVSGICIFERLEGIVRSVSSSLAEAGDLFSALIPIFSAVNVAGGGASTATAGTVGMSLTLGVMGFFSSEILIYAVFMMFLLGMLPDAQGIAAGVLRTIKGFFGWGVGVICFLLGATTSLQTVIATASDGILIRSARFTASSAIPVVGGAVSGALSTLASGLSYAKGVIGGGSLVAMITITLSPIVLLLAYRLMLTMTVNFLNFLGMGGGVRSFSAMLGALDSLIGVFAMSTIIYIFEIVLFIKSGVAIL